MPERPNLGTLDWVPALDRPELLAEPVRRALLDSPPGLDPALVFVAAIDPDLADTAAFCAAYQVPTSASANCVVVAGRRGEETTMAACLVLATDRADVNKKIRKQLGVRKISFASMDDAVTRTGMAYGGITPIGLPEDWPLLVDQMISTTGWIVIGSGVRGGKIAIPGAAAADLPGAIELDLAQRT